MASASPSARSTEIRPGIDGCQPERRRTGQARCRPAPAGNGKGNAFGKDKGANGANNDAPGVAVSGEIGRIDSGWGNGGENTEGNTPNSGGEGARGDNDDDHGNSGH